MLAEQTLRSLRLREDGDDCSSSRNARKALVECTLRCVTRRAQPMHSQLKRLFRKASQIMAYKGMLSFMSRQPRLCRVDGKQV